MVKKVILGVLGGLAIVVVVVLGFAATKPDTFRVERKILIAAPAAAVFPNLDDFHRWGAWSPWEHLDPAMQKTYGGPPTGPGATYAWRGNDQVGEGKMTVIESRPNEHLAIRLEFLKPFASTNTARYELKETRSGTEVSWVMEGPNTFMSKIMCVFVDMDTMIGGDFEKGLAALKQVSEHAAAAAMRPVQTEIVIAHTYDAPKAKVWKAWTDPKEIVKWWGPRGFTSPTAKYDLKVGGTYLVAMRGKDSKDFWSTGILTNVVPEESIEYEDSFADEKGNIVPATHYGLGRDFPLKMRMRVTFAEAEGKTTLTLTQFFVPRPPMDKYEKAGWSQSLDKLGETLK